MARRLPRAREQVDSDLKHAGMPPERALATAFRLLDLGYFRIGSIEVADTSATLRRSCAHLMWTTGSSTSIDGAFPRSGQPR
jgi:DNA topoisomerase IB